MQSHTAARATKAASASQWQPAKYLAFERHRLRPALELLARVHSLPTPAQGEPIRILDLGAGTGNMAPAFLQRWPEAHVTFVDTSPSMLTRARSDHETKPETAAAVAASRFLYQEASFESYTASEPVDLIFSNAALHWVHSELHQTLLPHLFAQLKPGGSLAFQIPDTRAQPSHQLMVAAAQQLGWWDDELADHVRWVTCEQEPGFYYDILAPLVGQQYADTHVDMWATTYAQIMEGENPVADFTASTGLMPYVDALGGRDSTRGAAFESKYRELIAKAYPKQEDGRTIFNLKRFFVVASKPFTP